jgi:tetratricopeptide (TPR) repeat protein
MSWDSGWTDLERPEKKGDVAPLMERARTQIHEADTRARLVALTETLEAALELDPDNREALADLAQFHTLLGTGYTEDTGDKEHHYRAAIRYSERLMYRNPEFRKLVDAGETVWDASRVLTVAEADGMGWWTTAVFYYFKECVADVLKIFSIKWIKRNRKVMLRLREVAPGWNRGANDFNFGIYYLAVPEAAGGDMEKSARYFKRALALGGPKRLLVRWGRGKYYHVKRGDRASFEADLRWVLAQDPRADTGDPYPWNVYFQREARALLAEADGIF